MARRDYCLGPAYRGDEHPLLRHIVEHHPRRPRGYPPQFALEFGVGDGATLRLIAAHMPTVGFDSFTGLPEDWRPGYPKGTFATSPPTVRNTRLVIGAFADTLPGFDFATVQPIGLVHFDADLYSSTKTALRHVGPHLRPGAVLVFDEWHGYPGCAAHEQRALREHARRTRIHWTVIGHDDQAWAIRLQ
jgi:SAM-dependent methyltransferase